MPRSQTLFNGSAIRRRERKEFRCERIDASTGQPCDRPFTRAWNLQRHERDHHQNQEVDLVHHNPSTGRFGIVTPPIAATCPASTIRLPRIEAMDSPLSPAPLPGNRVPRCSALYLPAPKRLCPYLRPAPVVPTISVPTPTMPSISVAYSKPTLMMPPISVASVPALSKARVSTTSSPLPHMAVHSSHNSPQLPVSRSNLRTLGMNVQRSSSSPILRPIRPVRRAVSVTSTAASIDPSKIDHSDKLAPSTQDISPQRSRSSTDFDDSRLQDNATEYTATPHKNWTGYLEQDSVNGDTTSDIVEQDHEEDLSGLKSSSEDSGGAGSRKRKRSPTRFRVIDARAKPAVPTYLVKMSKKTDGQQRALDWLYASGKAHLNSVHERILAQWGVKTKHWGTCVLLPEDWKAMDPVDLMAVYRDYVPPPNGSGRAWYAYSDHATSLARAVAWFSDRKWPQGPEGQVVKQFPRRGVDLDNFLACGSWGPMDASHLCHHEHCIIHLVYESAATNWDRGDCCLEARLLRQERRPVPEHCTKHWPPCMMQHAALTAREAYHIQFAVLRQAMGIAPTPTIPRPRRYQYPTLESQLPCSFSAVTIDSEDLVDEVLPAKKEGRPDLLCPFCPQIKTFASIMAFYGHLVNKHKNVGDQERLDEVFRTEPLWRAYWEEHSDGGKYSNPTMAKLNQIRGERFGWQQVLEWGLRS